MVLREADLHDVGELAHMLLEMTKEFYPNRELSGAESFETCIKHWILSPSFFVFVTEKDGEITGFMAFVLDDNFGLTQTVLNVIATYIKPKFRGSRNILVFQNFAVNFADKMKMNLYTSARLERASLSIKSGAVVQSVNLERSFNG